MHQLLFHLEEEMCYHLRSVETSEGGWGLMSFQEKVKASVTSIRNELERIEMHTTADELGGPDYETIEHLTDLIEDHLRDIRELICDLLLKEAEG